MKKSDRFFLRTVEHIHRVQNNMLYLVTQHKDFEFFETGEWFKLDDETCRRLMWNVMKHDQSKFSKKQCAPYIELTEYYHQRKKLGNKDYDYQYSEIREWVDAAVSDHYHVEKHHPERNKGLAKKMPFEELMEIVCDLQAMAQEFNEGSCRKYFEDIWCKKQSKNFYDDCDWEVSKEFMREVIKRFECIPLYVS